MGVGYDEDNLKKPMRFWKSRQISFFLWPLSLLYGLVVRIRNWMYDRGILRSRRLNAKVISIGNITVGGTGKTPFVQLVARYFLKKGVPVAVLSRGYGGKGKGLRLVSDGKSVLSNAHLAGDEPILTAKLLPGVPVAVSPDRIQSGEFAVRKFGSRVLVLDDAYQHRRVKRDCNIVLMNAEHPFGNGWLLPAGPLREPRSSLKRADVVVMTGSDNRIVKIRTAEISKWTKAPVLLARRRPTAWIRHGKNRIFDLGKFKGQSVLAFAGIGNPKSFHQTVSETGAVITRFIPFPDHYDYQTKDLDGIAKIADELKVRAVVTTEKDGVRIGSWKGKIPLYCLRIEMELDGGVKELEGILTPPVVPPLRGPSNDIY